MSEQRLVPGKETRVQLRVANSRFLATIAPVFTVPEARQFIDRLRAEFHDASHNVPAYLIGHGPAVTAHSSDDGEPSGTAGRPVLAVLQGSGLGDAAIVVTRYFGGTKLGTGGLVRAYGDAARRVLAAVPLAEKAVTGVVQLVVAYGQLEPVRALIGDHDGHIIDESFAADVTVAVRFRSSALPAFQANLREMSSGALQAQVVTSDEIAIFPLGQTGVGRG